MLCFVFYIFNRHYNSSITMQPNHSSHTRWLVTSRVGSGYLMPMSPLPHQTTLLRRYGVRTRLARLARSICPAFIFVRCPVSQRVLVGTSLSIFSSLWHVFVDILDIFITRFSASLFLYLRVVYFFLLWLLKQHCHFWLAMPMPTWLSRMLSTSDATLTTS